MSEELLKAIHQELVQIRQLLASGQSSAPRSSAPARSSAASTSSSRSYSSSPGSEEIPQPSEIIPNAGEVRIHFGKNNGVPLSQLGERSLSWYAQEQAPRLDSSGNPYPPRPQEITLRNAARTLWHQNKGTLAGAGAASAGKSNQDDFMESSSSSSASSSSHPSDEEVPF